MTVQELQKYKIVNLDGITIEGCIDNPTVNPDRFTGHVVGLKHAQLSRCLLWPILVDKSSITKLQN